MHVGRLGFRGTKSSRVETLMGMRVYTSLQEVWVIDISWDAGYVGKRARGPEMGRARSKKKGGLSGFERVKLEKSREVIFSYQAVIKKDLAQNELSSPIQSNPLGPSVQPTTLREM